MNIKQLLRELGSLVALTVLTVGLVASGYFVLTGVYATADFNASPQAWDTTWEADPDNTDAVSLGDDHLRQIKIELSDRLDVEHDISSQSGGTDTSDTGRHREGSAVVFYDDTEPAAIDVADDAASSALDDGRLWIDSNSTPDNKLQTHSGSAWEDVTVGGTITKSMYWPAGSFSSDGTQCADPLEVTINSGPKLFTVICTDNDASIMHGTTVMPDGWDAGTVTFELFYVQTAADTDVLNMDIAAQCRNNGTAINTTFGTKVAIDDAAVVGSSSADFTTSGAVTADGTCAAGDYLAWELELDATGTTTGVTTLHFVGLKMEYGWAASGD